MRVPIYCILGSSMNYKEESVGDASAISDLEWWLIVSLCDVSFYFIYNYVILLNFPQDSYHAY